jgi:hypothetical protein
MQAIIVHRSYSATDRKASMLKTHELSNWWTCHDLEHQKCIDCSKRSVFQNVVIFYGKQ